MDDLSVFQSYRDNGSKALFRFRLMIWTSDSKTPKWVALTEWLHDLFSLKRNTAHRTPLTCSLKIVSVFFKLGPHVKKQSRVKLASSGPLILVKLSWRMSKDWSQYLRYYGENKSDPPHHKTNKMTVCQVKTQISLGICTVWSESSLFAWRKLGFLVTHWAQVKTLIRLGGCPGWSESSLGTHATSLGLSCRGSNTEAC